MFNIKAPAGTFICRMLEVMTTTNPSFSTTFAKISSADLTKTDDVDSLTGSLNGVAAVSLIDAIAGTDERDLKYIHVRNIDTVPHNLVFEHNGFEVFGCLLNAGWSVKYGSDSSWHVYDENGLEPGGAATISSGQIGRFELASGAANSGHIASGAVQGFFGATRHIASGTVGSFDFGSGAVSSGHLASGQVGEYHLGQNAIHSGHMQSGIVSRFQLASGAINSGHGASGAVNTNNIASGAVTATRLGSGAVASGHIAAGGAPDATNFLRGDMQWASLALSIGSGDIGSGDVASGGIQGFFGATRHIASGTVGAFDFGSGAVMAGQVGSGAVQSGNVASGSIGQNHIADGAVNSGHYASGSIASGHLASGLLDAISVGSGGIGSGKIASGAVPGYFGPYRGVMSGTLGLFDFGSGAVPAGAVGSGAIVSGNIASGQVLKDIDLTFAGDVTGPSVTWAPNQPSQSVTLALGSGVVRSGHIGDSAVVSGSYASGSIASGHLASGLIASLTVGSGAVGSGIIASGAVDGYFGPSRRIQSGTVGVYDLGSGAVIAGTVGSGAVVSGNIASGQIGQRHLADGAVTSGAYASGSIASGHLASGLLSALTVGSGSIASGNLASGAVGGFYGTTRHIQSGTLGSTDFASGAVEAGAIGSGAVLSGNIASGQIGNNHVASGFKHYVSGAFIVGNTTDSSINIEGTAYTTHLAVHDDGAIDITLDLHKHSAVPADGPLLEMSRSRGTHGAPAVPTSGDYLGRLAWLGYDGNSFKRGAEVIASVASGAVQSGHMATQFEIRVTGGSGLPVTRLLIDRDGATTLTPASGIIVSGAIASGQVGQFHLASGAVTSGRLGVTGVPTSSTYLRGDFSWQPISVALGSGDAGSGVIASGAVDGYFGVSRRIQSGTIGVYDFGSGAVIAGAVGSGAVQSGNVASGAIGQYHLASGAVTSGHIGNEAVVSGSIASGSIDTVHVASGKVVDIATYLQTNAVVVSGSIASGAIFTLHVASGGLLSGAIGSGQIGPNHLASGAVRSGAIGSGQVSTNHFASGAVVAFARSTQDENFYRAFGTLSGGRAVSLDGSGRLVHADPMLGSTMPAFGVIPAAVASGQITPVYTFGRMYNSEFNFSGFTGAQVIWVMSGSRVGRIQPTGSGMRQQRMGIAVSQSGFHLNPELIVTVV